MWIGFCLRTKLRYLVRFYSFLTIHHIYCYDYSNWYIGIYQLYLMLIFSDYRGIHWVRLYCRSLSWWRENFDENLSLFKQIIFIHLMGYDILFLLISWSYCKFLFSYLIQHTRDEEKVLINMVDLHFYFVLNLTLYLYI